MSAQAPQPCRSCDAARAEAVAAKLPDYLHCDGVVLLPERHLERRGETDSYRGAWSRGLNLWIVVSRPQRRRAYWRAVLREHGALVDLVVADGATPGSAAKDLEIAIDDLRAAFGPRRARQ